MEYEYVKNYYGKGELDSAKHVEHEEMENNRRNEVGERM